MGKNGWALERKHSVRPSDPVCQSLHDIRFLVQDCDDDWAVDDHSDDVATLAPVEATLPELRRLPVFARGGVAGQTPCAYDVHSGSVPVVGGSEENAECPITQPPRQRAYLLRR